MFDQVNIRLAVPEERAKLEEIQFQASLAWESDRDWILAQEDLICLPEDQILAGHVLVADLVAGPVGFAVLLPRDDGDADLDGLFIAPTYWRKGIGRALVARAESLARERGARLLHVIGNPNAAGFYASCGFETLGTVPTRHSRALRLRKELA